jgi:hypothetical protein
MEKSEAFVEKKEESLGLSVYVEQLTEIQKKAMTIAEQHLGSSFNLKKSVGYSEFQAKKVMKNK